MIQSDYQIIQAIEKEARKQSIINRSNHVYVLSFSVVQTIDHSEQKVCSGNGFA